jgi:hypothetical protein
MNPNIGKRAGNYQKVTEKKPSAAKDFIELNTHKNIVLKRYFMYLEDVKSAININTLEERLKLTMWFLKQLESNTSNEKLIQELSSLAEKDRHTLQKKYKISI